MKTIFFNRTLLLLVAFSAALCLPLSVSAQWTDGNPYLTTNDDVNIGTPVGGVTYSLFANKKKNNWQARFDNRKADNSGGSDVYIASGANYGMYIKTYADDTRYSLTLINKHNPTNTFFNNGTVALGLQGNVGVGTGTPSYKLHVKGDVYANGGWVRVSGQRGIYFQSYGGGLYMKDNTWIRTYGNKSFYHNTGIMRTDGTFQVGPSGNRLVVKTDGKVGIGRTSPSYKLDVNGTARVTSLQQTSDKRFKKDIKGIDNALDKINTLDGLTYKFKNEKIGEYDFSKVKQEKQLGFLAQDVQEVFPELVSEDEDGYLSVNYIGLIPVLVEGLKEQQEVITDQREEIEDLQARMTKLEALLNTSETTIHNLSTPVENVTDEVILRQNAPNPFSGSTTIEYQLPNGVGLASLVVSDLNGRTVATYSISEKGNVQFNTGGLDNGVYTYAIIANGQSIAAQKMVIQK